MQSESSPAQFLRSRWDYKAISMTTRGTVGARRKSAPGLPVEPVFIQKTVESVAER